MKLIFNKKIVKKYNLWDHKQYTNKLFTVDKVDNCGLKQKKKMQCKNVNARIITIQTDIE